MYEEDFMIIPIQLNNIYKEIKNKVSPPYYKLPCHKWHDRGNFTSSYSTSTKLFSAFWLPYKVLQKKFAYLLALCIEVTC